PVLAGDRQLTLSVKGVASNGLVIVAAAEVTDRDAAQALRGTELTVERGSLPEAEGDEIYHADLIGLAAETPDGTLLGRLVALHDFGAGEIAEVKPERGPSVMLPFGPDFVPEIDLVGGSVVIVPPDGLLEMAAAAGSPPEDGQDG
ncbi:MAG: ribosome maturation factor RimM, partial [Pseudomonadota bacterium]|nr:ribosome maturation factor RimM [Pseudomonadota bacterium]